jgi:hypothetical protein
MRALAELVRRRQALVERCAAQRADIAAAARGLRGASSSALLLGIGAAGAAVVASPRLRRWAGRALAAYVFLRRL